MTVTGIKTRLLLYGAYGYTGRLTAELAAARKLDVVLAGRNLGALLELGDRLGLPTRMIRLDDPKRLSDALNDIACVVHMAGPFVVTSGPMLDACLATQTNYIDVTGEIEVFQAMWSRRVEIQRAGVTAIPGAGFDVVPTDCFAGYVAGKLHRPTSLLIALSGLQNVSQGTMRTAIRQISKPVLCQRGGTIVVLEDCSPHWIDFGSGEEPCVPLSWADVATAFHSTGVSNITVYFRHTKLFRLADVVGKLFGPLLRSRFGQSGLSAIVRRLPEGPNQAERVAMLKAVFASPQELNVPIIVGVSEGERKFLGVRELATLVRSLREEFDCPIFLNADHTHSLASATEAAKAGFDSIVFDLSASPFEENNRQTKNAIAVLKGINPAILIEGEIGTGSETDRGQSGSRDDPIQRDHS